MDIKTRLQIKKLIQEMELDENPNEMIFSELSKTNKLLEKVAESSIDMSTIAKLKGEKGDKGDKPIAGIDFPIPKDGYTPIKGIDYRDGIDGKDGEKGKDGKNGKDGEDGKTPVLGIDFTIPEAETPESLALKINTLQDAINVSVLKGYNKPDEIVALVIKELKKQNINATVTPSKVLGKGLNMNDMRWHGSGVPSLTAGTNITLTPTADGGYIISATGGGGAGTVTDVSVVSANGLAGTVATSTTTPAITLSTTVTGILKGNGTAISAAAAGTDYVAPGSITTSGLTQNTARLLGRTTAGSGAVEEISAGTGISLSAGTLSAAAAGLTVGTSPIASGSNTKVLYDNSGVLGEYTVSGSGNVAMTTSPVFTTPNIGVATATSVNGLTITSSTGTLTITNGKTLSASNTITLTGTDGVSANVSNLKVRTIGFSSQNPVTGQQGTYVVFPVAGTITGYKIVADAGTATIKTWKIASGTSAPTIANVISTSGVSLSSGTAIISSTVTDFTTTTVSANDIFAFDLTAVATATKLLFELEITVT